MLKNREGCTLPACAFLKEDTDDGARGEALPQSTETGQYYWVTDTLSPVTTVSDMYDVMQEVLPS